MKLASTIVLKILSLLLLTGASLKGWQLLTEPVANNDIWTNRTFLILVVEFEIGLGIWLISGLFKKAAWIATISCFTLFSFITLYKGITGAASCGCFGSVHVNPWITLFAIDLPSVAALAIFRPKGEILFDWPAIPRFVTTAFIGLVILGASASTLAFNEPAAVTSSYEVLEPLEWVGKELPILEHIDIGDKLKTGNWLVLFYHHDCPDCQKAKYLYENLSEKVVGLMFFLKVAIVEFPPFDHHTNKDSMFTHLYLEETKSWFCETPTVLLLSNSVVKQAWIGHAPDLDTIFNYSKNYTYTKTCKLSAQ